MDVSHGVAPDVPGRRADVRVFASEPAAVRPRPGPDIPARVRERPVRHRATSGHGTAVSRTSASRGASRGVAPDVRATLADVRGVVYTDGVARRAPIVPGEPERCC